MAVNRPWFEFFCAFLYTSTHCKLDHSCLERNWEGPWNSWLWEHLQNYVQASFRRDLYACCSEGLLGQWSVLKWYNIWVPLSDCHLSDTIRYFSDSNSENWLISHIVWGAIFVFRGTQICWGKAEYAVGERINSGIWRSVSKLKENIEALWSITLLDDLSHDNDRMSAFWGKYKNSPPVSPGLWQCESFQQKIFENQIWCIRCYRQSPTAGML